MTISRPVRERAIKRAIDIIGALVLLLALAPSMLGIAMLVRLRSGKPILYREQRVGRGGKPFTLFKFRTLDEGSASARSIAPEDDPRITMVGLPLRRTRLDELPQLYNVLVGDMSLVGPRPIIYDEVPLLESWQHDRHLCRPGLTGLWQVSGRKETSWDERIALDLEYVRTQSLRKDTAILVRTVGVVIRGDGAY